MTLVAKNPSASAGDLRDLSSVLGLERFPWRREWLLTPVFLLGESYGQRNLAGYSPWGRKESNTTKCLNTQHMTAGVGGVDGSL